MRINGNLTLPTGGLGQIENLVAEKLASTPVFDAAEAGRIIHNTGDGTFYINNGTVWVAIATGGDATALQTEVDEIELSLGGLVDGTGAYVAATADAYANVSGSTSIENVLFQLDAAISGIDTLAELGDTTITSAAEDDFLVYDITSSKWLNESLASVKSKLSIVIGTDVQAFDAELDGLSALSGTGIVVKTGAGTFAERTMASTSAGLVIGNGDGVASNPSFALDAGLDSIAGLSAISGDIIYATAGDTYAAGQPGVTSGVQAFDLVLDDLSGLAVVATDQMIYGTGAGVFGYSTITTFARTILDDADEATVRATIGLDAGGAGDIWVEKAGDAMTGDLNLSTNFVLSSGVPTLDAHLVNKLYVDNNLAGLKWKNSVTARSTANIDLTTGTALTIDGIALSVGDRVLVADQSSGGENGIYIVASGSWTRATDFDSVTPIDEVNSAAMFVEQGTIYADTGWTQTATIATVGTESMVFTQFNGAAGVVAGTGLVKTGNTLDINMGAGIAALPSDEVGIDLFSPTGGALILTDDGANNSTLTGAKLHLQIGANLSQDVSGLFITAGGVTGTELNVSVAGAGLGGGGGSALSVNVDGASLEIVGDTLNVKALGVTNAMLANSVITMAGDTGSDDVALGETFTFTGTDAIDTAMVANVLTVSAKDATDSQKGVATFNTGNFTVTGADVTLNSSLADLTNVVADSTTAGDILVNNGTNYANKQIHHVEASASATSHVITHSLGQQYVNVTIVETSTGDVIIPQNIRMDSSTQLTVTLNSALAITIISTGI